MSARKRTTITLSEDQYRKLYEAGLKKKYLDKELPRVNKQIQKESKAYLNRSLEDIKRRDNEFKGIVSDIDNELAEIDTNISSQITEVQESLILQVNQSEDDLWNGTQNILQDMETRFQDLMQNGQQERDLFLSQIDQQMHGFELNKKNKQVYAEEWLDHCENHIRFIEKNYHHQLLVPGELQKLEGILQQASQNAENGLTEAAILGRQNLFSQASDLRMELEKLTSQWNLLFRAVLDQSKRLQFEVEQNSKLELADLEGNPLDEVVDVNIWSEGDYQKIKDYVDQLIKQLNENKQMLGIDLLKELNTETLPGLCKDFEKLLRSVNQSVMNSQLRINIADLVMEALHDQGFVLSKSGYQEGDLRSSYFLDVKNPEGSQVQVEVKPNLQSFYLNDLLISSNDHEHINRHELRQRSKEIRKSLQHYNLQTGAITTMPEKPLLEAEQIHEAGHKSLQHRQSQRQPQLQIQTN